MRPWRDPSPAEASLGEDMPSLDVSPKVGGSLCSRILLISMIAGLRAERAAAIATPFSRWGKSQGFSDEQTR